jgi:CBS domain-containing protein
MHERKIGEPIPLGIVTKKDVIDLSLGGPPDQAIADEISDLRNQIAELRTALAKAGKTTARSIEAHPLLAATVVSLGLWALIGVGSRRVFRVRR